MPAGSGDDGFPMSQGDALIQIAPSPAARMKPQRAVSGRTGVLVGIAGSNNGFSLSLYNLKAYAYRDPEIRRGWNLLVLQHPLINVDGRSKKVAALAEQIVAHKPELVAFSCYMWNVKAFQELGALLRSRLPQVKIAWGGPEITTDYVVEGKYDDTEADFLVSGEGELTFLELLRNLSTGTPALPQIHGLSFRGSGLGPYTINSRRVPFKSLVEVPSPFLTGVVDDDVLLRKRVQANLETQRGCSLRCSYCIYHKDMDRISYAAVQRVLEEVTYVTNKGVRDIRFVDANFSSDLDHAKAVMRGMIERRFEAKLMFELIPGFIDEELAALFGEYNALYEWNDITLGIGVQTTNLDVLRKVRRAIRVERFEQTFDLIQKYNVYAKIDLIIGMPGEDIASIERTLEYMLGKLAGSRSHLLCCHVMRGLPGTELLDIAKEHGMVFSSQYEPHELIESPILPRADMLKCLRRTAVVFRLINHSGWASKEFISGKSSSATHIADAFFAARARLGVSHIAVVDRIVDALMEYLKERDSLFVQPEFPYAETWWWSRSALEVEDEWLTDFLASLQPETDRLRVSA
jgi:radical SAM superfamily enzyme YgiQ (UPF0313 family)